MLSTLVGEPFDDEEWLFEIKLDGYRALAFINKSSVSLYSRNHHAFNALFPSVVQQLSKLKVQAILDGEIVILDAQGKSEFQLMQNYQKTHQGALYYYVFDILYLNGKDLRELPLIKRKQLLKDLLSSSKELSLIRYSDHILGKGIKFFNAAKNKHLEGIIGKKLQSHYYSKRSSEWVKIKTLLRQEAVIVGFTKPRGARKYFGSLLLGVYNDNGDLIYIGHSGGGFDEKLLSELYAKMKSLIQKQCPFVKSPKTKTLITWIKPKLVCEVTFSEWTHEGIIRQPVFEGLRIDKKPKEVKKEMPITKSPHKKIKSNEEDHPKLTNLSKIYWPKQKYTKGDLISYYREVAPYILPYLKNRPLMIRRFPDGITGKSFYQKDSSSLHLPEWMKTVDIEHDKKKVQYLLIEDLASLEYVINLGTIELHPFNSQVGNIENPDYLVIDLDPEVISFDKVIEVAQEIHKILDQIKVKNFCKTSGKTGLHIYVPLNGKYSYDQASQFGQIISMIVHDEMSEMTSLMRLPSKRQEKVYIDILQNAKGKTVACPYSVRASPFAPISTPLEWSEVKKGLDPTKFNIKTIPKRLKKIGDIFAPVLGKEIDLMDGLENLQKLRGEKTNSLKHQKLQ